MPPCSLNQFQVAVCARPIAPYAEAGPLYAAVPPMRISVSVTPFSAARATYGMAGVEAAAWSSRRRRMVAVLRFFQTFSGYSDHAAVAMATAGAIRPPA